MPMLSSEIMFWKRTLHNHVHIDTYIHMWKALYQNTILELGIGIASSFSEMVLNVFWKRALHLFVVYDIATVFQLYHSSDMMYAMRWRKPKLTHLPTQGIFNFPHYIGMAWGKWEQLAFNDAANYTQQGKCIAAQLTVISVTRTLHLLGALTNWAVSPPLAMKPSGGWWGEEVSGNEKG